VKMIGTAADAIEMILAEGVSRAMSRFNRRDTPEEDAEEEKSS
jgi:hypothetical protein